MTRKTWILATVGVGLASVVAATAQTPAPGTPPGRRSLFGRALKDPAVVPAAAQAPAAPAPTTPPAAGGAAAGSGDPTYKSNAALPEPAAIDELPKPSIVLPTTPIEPYLLQRHNGPFMVMAHTFRGPDAARYAQALAMELRNQHGLPAYVYFLRFQPGHSNIRNVPPTAPPQVRSGENVVPPESFRSYDEAAVLVGDCKTIDDSEKVLHQVKKLRSAVLDGLPSIWTWRKGKGLTRAMLTTNPLVASQELFPAQERRAHIAAQARGGPGLVAAPGQTVDPSVLTAGFESAHEADPLLKQMNSGPNSVLQCPGPLVLEVATFMGRSTTDLKDPQFQNDSFLRQSPLAAAADKAEHLVSSIGRCKSVTGGYKAYVFHDRTASRVYLGPFQSPQDPRLLALLTPNASGMSQLNEVSMELLKRGFTQLPLAPASQLVPVPQP